METLIEDLLKLSRVSRSELQRQQVNLSQIADSIAADLKKSDPQRAVEFAIEPGLQARGDERLLRVALDNLLRNAWKFTSKQPLGKIEVGSSKGPPQAFFVRDNGAGFDMTYSSRLFGVFQRLHTVSEFPGTGVGLATVQRIISRHGGRVWATGEINRGATFYFTLPPHEDSWGDSQIAGAGSVRPACQEISQSEPARLDSQKI
jgi:light-regulated signal transduction histidine kinase (bacteriophytochrome)